ncbi:hypothetical protein [Actinokineospora globicatena]|uniref:Uncharacterized protein n=1 Tax=Actinokineospora globicatena TaxID=103729 RepID=A0A9W6V9Y6_9PSEU|nr:hypothetical protein [Actinokineospora globicatena]GLW92434.1 hypothetical protein Aglo03_32500 [Actinokineospora globicatena]
MRRAVVAAAVLLGCVACQDTGSTPAPGGTGSVEQDLGGIESTLDNVESELAGD